MTDGKKTINKGKRGVIMTKAVAYTVLSLGAFGIIFPFLFAFVTSFTEPTGIYDFKWIPNPITFENYEELFENYNIFGGFLNTILYITPPIVIGVLTSAMAAYGFARLNFPGKEILFYAVLSTMLIPGIITMIPSFIMYSNVYHWVNTPLPLIVPGLFGAASTMFFLKQYIQGIPRSLEEAAYIDGMSKGGVFFTIILPLAKVALIAQFVLSFNGAYNDYLGPLLYVGTQKELFTLQLVLNSLQSQGRTPYTLMMAGSMTAMLPMLLMFIFAQKYFIEGISMTGIKE